VLKQRRGDALLWEVAVASWAEFEAAAPTLAATGRALLYQFGAGLAFLATTRADGGPRLHQICPTVFEGQLYAFITSSPKRRDLLRDGRYALHTFLGDSDEEFMLLGRASVEDDSALYAAVASALQATGVRQEHDDLLFTFEIVRAFHSGYKGSSAAPDPPVRSRWP
jgi:hypothetical protein